MTLILLGMIQLTWTSAPAAAGQTCENMSLLMSNEKILFLGDKLKGAQPGDRRILNWRVHDSDGSKLGAFHVVTTVLSDTENGHFITSTGSLVVDTGEVHAIITTELPDASSEAQSSTDAVNWAIVGGTGEFAHATGTLITAPPQHSAKSLDDWALDVAVACRP
ncbi:MAG: hypothetical protein AAF362_13240 [Pseudomonadota bacterium]